MTPQQMKCFRFVINTALGLKETRQSRRQFHVAAIFKRGELITLNTNSTKTHPLISRFYPYWNGVGMHAELAAVVAANKLRVTFTDKDIYVVRIDNNGMVANSKPCSHCANLIKFCGFKNVIHS